MVGLTPRACCAVQAHNAAGQPFDSAGGQDDEDAQLEQERRQALANMPAFLGGHGGGGMKFGGRGRFAVQSCMASLQLPHAANVPNVVSGEVIGQVRLLGTSTMTVPEAAGQQQEGTALPRGALGWRNSPPDWQPSSQTSRRWTAVWLDSAVQQERRPQPRHHCQQQVLASTCRELA